MTHEAGTPRTMAKGKGRTKLAGRDLEKWDVRWAIHMAISHGYYTELIANS